MPADEIFQKKCQHVTKSAFDPAKQLFAVGWWMSMAQFGAMVTVALILFGLGMWFGASIH